MISGEERKLDAAEVVSLAYGNDMFLVCSACEDCLFTVYPCRDIFAILSVSS